MINRYILRVDSEKYPILDWLMSQSYADIRMSRPERLEHMFNLLSGSQKARDQYRILVKGVEDGIFKSENSPGDE